MSLTSVNFLTGFSSSMRTWQCEGQPWEWKWRGLKLVYLLPLCLSHRIIRCDCFPSWRLQLLSASHLHADVSTYCSLLIAELIEVESEKKRSVLAVLVLGSSWCARFRSILGSACILRILITRSRLAWGRKGHLTIRTAYAGDCGPCRQGGQGTSPGQNDPNSWTLWLIKVGFPLLCANMSHLNYFPTTIKN